MKTAFFTIFLSCAIAHAATVNIPLGANIQAAVDANPAGTIFQLAAGLYSMQTVIPKDGDQFIGALDGVGNRLTTLSGAQSLTSFTRDGFGNYVAMTTQTQPGQQTGYCSPGYSRCNLPEDFFYDNEPYLHNSVGGAALAAGQYYFEYPNGRIYFRPKNSGDDPNQHKVEYSRIRSAILGGASNVTVRNLIVEKYAIPDQFGAIGDQYPGEGWVLQNNETRLNHGLGLRVSTNGQVLDNYTHDNGEMGMGGSGTNILVQGNEIAHNSYTGTDHNFECGGFKFANTEGLTVRNNYSHDNIGPGMWTDVSSIRTLYENNRVMNNTGAGIFYETSYDAIIRNNTILNNGSFSPDDWFWNAQLQIAASQNVEAYGNVILVNSANNGNGIMLIQQNRSGEPCTYGPCRVVNNFIHDNIIIVTGTRWHGSSGGAQDYTGQGDLFAPTSNNRFVGNQYYVTDLKSAAYWQWGNASQTFSGFKLLGLEPTGTVSPNSTSAQ
jgi:parallel beta-helix repeat protein